MSTCITEPLLVCEQQSNSLLGFEGFDHVIENGVVRLDVVVGIHQKVCMFAFGRAVYSHGIKCPGYSHAYFVLHKVRHITDKVYALPFRRQLHFVLRVADCGKVSTILRNLFVVQPVFDDVDRQ